MSPDAGERGACLVCGQVQDAQAVCAIREVERGERFTLTRCGGCGVLRTAPVPADLRPYYDAELGGLMRSSGSGLHARLKRVWLARELRRVLRAVTPSGFVDIGAGAGEFARVIHEAGFSVTTLDAGGAPVETRGDADIPHVRMDYSAPGVPETVELGGRVAVLRHVLEHLADPVAMLEELRRRGAAGVYLVVPNAGSLERRLLGRAWYLWDPPRHLWHFTPATLRLVVVRAGFSIVASGLDTIPNLLPSLYRRLRLAGAPSWLTAPCRPKSALTALSAPLNFLLPGNVCWAVATPAGPEAAA
ncbi:MAG TPA: class I SAM-dependent methyltransferase [bacterium]